jgi:hypothetical protein
MCDLSGARNMSIDRLNPFCLRTSEHHRVIFKDVCHPSRYESRTLLSSIIYKKRFVRTYNAYELLGDRSERTPLIHDSVSSGGPERRMHAPSVIRIATDPVDQPYDESRGHLTAGQCC